VQQDVVVDCIPPPPPPAAASVIPWVGSQFQVGALPAGAYTVGYRIVSDDGHPVSGSVRFTLTQAGPGHGVPAAESAGSSTGSAAAAAPGQPGQPDGTSGASSDSGSGGIPAWPWVVGGVLLVAAGAAIALRLGKGAGD